MAKAKKSSVIIPGRDGGQGPIFSDEHSPLLKQIAEELQNKFGPRTLFRASGVTEKRFIPTNSFLINYVLNGGIPVNRITLFYGVKEAFKTTQALKVLANYQRLCSFCLLSDENCSCSGGPKKKHALIVDMEKSLNEEHMMRLGVNPEWVIVSRPMHGEEACEVTEYMAKSGEIGFTIFDTLAAISSRDEVESGYLDSIARGSRARLIARLYRAMISFIDRPNNPSTAIMINHMLPRQDGMGVYLPGGETQKYLSGVVIRYMPIEKKKTVLKDGKEKIATFAGKGKQSLSDVEGTRKQRLSFLVEYSKVGKANVSGEFSIMLDDVEGGYFADADDFSTVFLYGQQSGWINRDGKGLWVVHGIDEPQSAQKDVFAIWKNHPMTYMTFQRQIIQSRVRLPEDEEDD